MTGSSSSSRGLPLVVSFLIFGLCWCVFISCPRSKAAYMCNVQCASNIDETLLFCCDLSDLPLSRSQAEGSNARDANQDSSIEDVTRVKPLIRIKCSKYKTLPEIDSMTWIKFSNNMASLALVAYLPTITALPHSLELSYWHYQLVLSWYLHQPE